MKVQYLWSKLLFNGMYREAFFLYLKFLPCESIIPFRPVPDRKLACLFQASLCFDNHCPNLHSPIISVFMLHSVLLQSEPQTGSGNAPAKNACLLWDIPEVSQNETTGVLRMLT